MRRSGLTVIDGMVWTCLAAMLVLGALYGVTWMEWSREAGRIELPSLKRVNRQIGQHLGLAPRDFTPCSGRVLFPPLSTEDILSNTKIYGGSCYNFSHLLTTAVASNYDYEGTGLADDDAPPPPSVEDSPMDELIVDGVRVEKQPDGTWQ